MKRLAILALALSSAALAQSAAVEPLRQEGNAADRGYNACRKGNQQAKCVQEIEAASQWNNEARRAVGLPALVPEPAPTPVPTPTPSPTASPTPTPVPTPTPSPTPSPSTAAVTIDGDSIDYMWAGSWSGMYKASRPDLTVIGRAVSGSTLDGLTDRLTTIIADRPGVFVAAFGENDFTWWNFPTTREWVARYMSLTDQVRATGAKVVVMIPTKKCGDAVHNQRQAEAIPLLVAQLGVKIDALIRTDQEPRLQDPCDKQYFTDGLHPTDDTHVSSGVSGQRVLFELAKPVIDSALQGASTTPSPAPLAGYVPSPSLAGGPELVASFPIREGLVPSWGTGGIPGQYAPQEGAFRFTCGGEGELRYDDPLIYPGQADASHLHKFFGANGVTSATTSDNLSAVTSSTCNYGDKVLNRSAYWMPAVLDDAGYVRNPDWIAVYYKRAKANSPACTGIGGNQTGICIGLPNQIRFVYGWDPTNPEAEGEGNTWYCSGGTGGHFKDLDAVFQSGCKAGDQLIADIVFPDCWDGTYLDTPDHRSHMSFGGYGSWGYYKCPDTHPYLIPQTTNKYSFTVTADMYSGTPGTLGAASRIFLASDHMKTGAKPGETLHGDYMERWVAAVKQMWLEGCINRGLDCSGGDLGNGQQIRGAASPSYGWSQPNPKSSVTYTPMAP